MNTNILTIVFNDKDLKIAQINNDKNIMSIGKNTIIPIKEGVIVNGYITDINYINDLIRSKLQEVEILDNEVIFVVDSDDITYKEFNYDLVNDKKVNNLVLNDINNQFSETNDKFYYNYNFLSKTLNKNYKQTRVVVYQTPVSLLKPYSNLASMLDLTIRSLDFVHNSIMEYIKMCINIEPSLVIQIKKNLSIIRIYNEKVLMLQTTISYGTSYNNIELLKALIDNTSRMIKYYLDKNNKYHIKNAYIFCDEQDCTNIINEFAIKTQLSTSELGKDVCLSNLRENIGCASKSVNLLKNICGVKGTLNYYFSPIRLSIILIIAIFFIALLEPTINYIFTLSEKNEISGDIDAIDDIKMILDEYKDTANNVSNINLISWLTSFVSENLQYTKIVYNKNSLIIFGNCTSKDEMSSLKLAIQKKSILKLVEYKWENELFEINCDLLNGE